MSRPPFEEHPYDAVQQVVEVIDHDRGEFRARIKTLAAQLEERMSVGARLDSRGPMSRQIDLIDLGDAIKIEFDEPLFLSGRYAGTRSYDLVVPKDGTEASHFTWKNHPAPDISEDELNRENVPLEWSDVFSLSTVLLNRDRT